MEPGVELKKVVEELKASLELIKASGIREVPAEVATLQSLEEAARSCSACCLAKGRSGFGFGAGKKDPDLLFVTPAPFGKAGAYSGEAGGLLEKMIEAMGYETSGVYLAFALKCAPPEGRGAEEFLDGLRSCRGHLLKQIRLLAPKVVVALGGAAAAAVLEDEGGAADVATLRSIVHELGGASLIVTWGLEELLERPALKREAWEDLKLCMGLLAKG